MKRLCAISMAAILGLGTIFGLMPGTSSDAATVKYLKKKTTVTFTDKKGIKSLAVNGKLAKIKKGSKKVKYTFKKEGKYVVKVTNRKKKTTKKTYVLDMTAPVIEGVKNGMTYVGEVSITAKDNFKISSFKVNGKNTMTPFTTGDTGAYEVVAKDMAGNKTSINFFIDNTTVVSTASASAVCATQDTKINSTSTPTPMQTNGVKNTSTPNPTISAAIITPDVTPNKDILNPIPTAQIIVTDAPTDEPQKVCNHSWDNGTVRKYSTCTEHGIKEYKCLLCGATEERELDLLEHSWDTGTVIRASTCTVHGIIRYTCKECNETKDESLDLLEHKYNTKVITKQPECEVDGSYHMKCDYCEACLEEQTIPKLGHNFQNSTKYPVKGGEATCQHGNYYYKECENCHKSSEEYGGETWEQGEPIQHHFQEKDYAAVKYPATCTSPVIYKYKCTMCDLHSDEFTYVSDRDEDKALEHKYDIEYDVTPATTCEDKTYYLRCSREGCSTCEGIKHTAVGSHTDKEAPSIYWTGHDITGTPRIWSENAVNYNCVFTGVAPGNAALFYASFDVKDEGGSGLKTVKTLEVINTCRPEAIDPTTGKPYISSDITKMYNRYEQSADAGTTTKFISSGVGKDMSYSGTTAKHYTSYQVQTLDNYGFVYIYAEDWAGNVTIVRTSDLIPNAFGNKTYD